MKVRTLSRGTVIAIGFGVLLLGVVAYAATTDTQAVGTIPKPQLSVGFAPVTSALPNDPISEWNQNAVTLALLPASALSPIQQARVMAIVQVAVHDAVNGITGEYETYLSPGAAPANASPEAAAIAAAHHALRNLFSSQSAAIDALYGPSLAAHGLSEFDPGIEYGRSAAAAILAARADDQSAQAQFAYTAPGAGSPGVWVPISSAPNAQALLPGWGNVTPFVLRSGSQFRPGPPPALDSDQYAQDYNEIKIIGASSSPTRTAEQTQIGQFWLASPPAIWNPVLTQLLATRNLDLSETARVFALMYLAAADASIACWDAKYTYNFWRPQPAIRGGNSDGNDLTIEDLTWLPLHATPRHPEYPSGHSTVSSAMAAVLKSIFADDPGVPLVVTLSGITRQWFTLSQGVDEVIEARIYSGIHFRTSDEVGARVGRQVAQFASTHALRPCRKGGSRCS